MLKGVHTSGLFPCNWSQLSHIGLTSTRQASSRGGRIKRILHKKPYNAYPKFLRRVSFPEDIPFGLPFKLNCSPRRKEKRFFWRRNVSDTCECLPTKRSFVHFLDVLIVFPLNRPSGSVKIRPETTIEILKAPRHSFRFTTIGYSVVASASVSDAPLRRLA